MPNSTSLESKFQRLLEIMKTEQFLRMQGLGNEVPFFIVPYDPREANREGQVAANLMKQLQLVGIAVLTIDLYDLTLEMLLERDLLDTLLDREDTLCKSELMELLQNVLDPETHLVPGIERKLQAVDPKILFITGVGQVYPYIRTHNVLSNLQRAAKKHPTVMFFPGEYTHSVQTGANLSLFGRVPGDKYYRAFNFDDYQL